MLDLIKSEPVALQFAIQAFLGLLLSFGVHLTAKQIADVLLFTGAVMALWTRAQVTPHINNPAMNPAVAVVAIDPGQQPLP